MVHVGRRPRWANDLLDPARTLQEPQLDVGDSALIDAGEVVGGAGTRLRFAEGARFWIAASLTEIWMEFDPPLIAADAAYFLFEPVLGFVLRARGVLALHASAVAIGARAVLFCGAAGAGKSTTAAACVAQGGRLLSDDVVALAVAGGRWVGHVGTRSIRLWDDGLAALGRDAAEVPPFSPTWAKRALAVEQAADAEAAPVPLGLICVFAERDASVRDAGAERLPASAAWRELIVHTTANRLHDARRRATELGQLAQLVTAVPVVRLRAPADGVRLPEVVHVIRTALDG